MRPADTWKDYELLDATGGNRLERWGETILIRPDPQVVWKTPRQSPLWAKADAVYHRSNQGGGEWEYRRRLPEKWKISCGEGEEKLTLIVSPTGFKHTGVFPEQAVNWAWYASYGRGPGGEIWKLEDCIYDLISQCEEVLSDKPLFFAVNSYTTGLSPAVMEYMLKTTLVPRFGGQTSCDEIGLPVSATGGVVPCGATAIWEE